MELNDIYDEHRNRTGRLHRRGAPWKAGEYGLVVCVWVHDGNGKLLMTRRAPQKSFGGTWEYSGGAAKAGETSRQAVARELFEETGILRDEDAFEFLSTTCDSHCFYDHYCIEALVSLDEIVLQPGETDAVKWVAFDAVHEMIERKEICAIIAEQFLRKETELRKRQNTQET
jgi:mutator protein MutT